MDSYLPSASHICLQSYQHLIPRISHSTSEMRALCDHTGHMWPITPRANIFISQFFAILARYGKRSIFSFLSTTSEAAIKTHPMEGTNVSSRLAVRNALLSSQNLGPSEIRQPSLSPRYNNHDIRGAAQPKATSQSTPIDKLYGKDVESSCFSRRLLLIKVANH